MSGRDPAARLGRIDTKCRTLRKLTATKPDHQAKVSQLKENAKAELKPGELILSEEKIRVNGSNRKPDVQIIDNEGKTRKVFEAERYPNRKRNRDRENEYKMLNIEYETHSLY